jgi:mannose-6-phosphate isomerase-like protein (cupin superfamily)
VALARDAGRDEVSLMTPDRISLDEKFASFSDHWQPRIIGELNGQHVKVAKVRGEFMWHHHEHEDELFLVHRGTLRLEFRDRTVTLGPGEMLIVPRGVEHRPVADDEVELVLFEPAGTLNTGNLVNERTVASPARL